MSKFKEVRKSVKAVASAALAAALVLQSVPLNVLASTGDPTFITSLESNVGLMDGQPMDGMANKHYYGGTKVDGTHEASVGRLAHAASYGNGTTTAYKFGWIRAGSSGSFLGWKFDFNGIIDKTVLSEEPDAETKEAYYISDQLKGGALSITYPSSDPQGFNSTLGFGVQQGTAQGNSSYQAPSQIDTAISTYQMGRSNALKYQSSQNPFYPEKDGEWRNGEVVKVYENGTDLKLEVRLSVKPSPDRKYILTEYTVHNANTDVNNANAKIVDANRKGGDGGRTVWFSAGTDIMIAGHDGAPVWSTEKRGSGDKIEGLHGQSNDSSSYTLASFDLLTYHPQMSLGIRKRDNTDPSKLTTWVGHYIDFTSNYYKDLEATSYMPNGTYNALDSGLAYSMRFDLLPGETKTGTFAWSMKGPTYYVDSVNGDDSSGNGHMSKPYKTIEKALQTIGSRTPEIVFINVMNDIEVNSTLKIPANKDVTISTTDYIKDVSSNSKVSAYPIQLDSNNVRTNQKVIKRGANLKGDLFEVSNAGSALRFTDIIVDGNKDAVSDITGSLVRATTGIVDLQTGAELKNNKLTKYTETFTDSNNNGKWDTGENFVDANSNGRYDDNSFAASAIEISDGASLSMSTGGTIKDNISYQGAAVRKQGTGKFTLGGSSQAVGVTIDGNTNAAGSPANTQLDVMKAANQTVTGEANKIEVTGALASYSKVGIGTFESPVSQSVAIPVITYNSNLSAVPYTINNFGADKTPGQWLETVANDNIDLFAGEFAYSIDYMDEDKTSNLRASVGENKVVGKKIDASPADLTAAGYIYTGYEIDPATGHGLSIDNNGNIQGFMPSSNVSIIYKYAKNTGIFKFLGNGGNPATQTIVSAAGQAPTASLPTATRTGYTLNGWYLMTNDANNDGEYTEGTDTLATTKTTALDNPVQRGTKIYVAKWDVAPDVYIYTQTHKNNNATLPITFKSELANQRYLDQLTASPMTIPGYQKLSQSVNPRSAGTFNGNGVFTGNMPLGAVTVDYKYRVDNTQRFAFTVEHYNQTTGAMIDTQTIQRPAETQINARPLNTLVYRLSGKAITAGDTATAPVMKVSEMIPAAYATTGETVGFQADDSFKAFMPNQNVTIRYTYTSAAENYVSQKYIDSTSQQRIDGVDVTEFATNAAINLPAPDKYGYVFGSGSADRTGIGTFDASGAFTGTMQSGIVALTYNMNRDPNYWKQITYQVADAPYNKGSLSSPASFTFLKDDGTARAAGKAHTFADIKASERVAIPTPNPTPYYKFDGWYMDPAGTTPVADTQTFNGDVTVYAKFVEDPAYWIDINFAEKENGRVTGPRTLHTYFDNKWGDITANIPAVTPTVNYILDKWTVDDAPVSTTTALENNKTYYATFKKDPSIWGTDLGYFDPVGSIQPNGKGNIRVSGVYRDNVYVVTDNDGKIVDVIKAPSDGIINFNDLYPGSKYKVYEGSPDTVATKGQDIGTVTGTNLSAPKDVVIPAVGNNYGLGYDPVNDGKVQIVVDPADPDSDYALVDEQGNIVPYDDSDGGWKHASDPTNPKVVFDNLEPNRTYKVIARKKGDTSKTHTDPEKLEAGVDIMTTPGDEFEIPKYIVETKNGVIETVADTTVGTDRYTETKKGDVVKVHAEGVDANGNAFKYWKVMNGHNSGIVGNVNTTDLTFTMEATNIVLKAVYERAVTSPQNAIVEEESRGGGIGEFALNPGDIPRLEEELTTDKDRELINTNGAEVVYKIVFNKRDAKQTEKNDVRAVSISGTQHPDAHTAAWGLDIFADRYVDGRKVDRATSSDAAVTAVIQLNSKDLDMLDYQIFDVTTPGSPIEVTPSHNPEETAGLFEFPANVNHKYVLVYSRAFKVTFIDNKPALDHEHLNDLSHNFFKRFKVRRGETVADADYMTDYSVVTDYAHGSTAGTLKTPFYDVFGAKYDYQNWSKTDQLLFADTVNNLRAFDEAEAIKKSIVLYAVYKSDRPQVDEARVKLTNSVAEAEDFYNNPYITTQDGAELRAAIDNAKEVLARHRGDASGNLRQANYDELQAAFDLLEGVLNRLRNQANNRQLNYSGRTGGSSGGGGGSAGRGKGTTARPFEATAEKTFTLGVNGTWRKDPATGKFQYLIYGGMPLNNTWGKILHTDENGRQLTDWYFFDNQANMVTGWYRDPKTNNWYFLSTAEGKDNGKMLVGWFKDSTNRWYYFDMVDGSMYRGWRLIGDKWYYFANGTTADGRPDGSLYVETTTPDGYRVNANGEWVQ